MKANANPLSIVFFWSATFAPQAFAQPISKDVFLREAPKGWAKLEEAAFRGKVTVRHTDKNGSSTSECEFQGAMSRIRMHVGGYSFTTWKSSPKETTYGENRIQQEVYDHLRSPFSIYGVPLRELLADPSFKVVAVSSEPDGKVRATFDYDGDHNGEPRKFYTKGWCVVDPQRQWAVTRVFIENPRYQSNKSQPFWHPKMEYFVEYLNGDGVVPALKRHFTLRPDGKTSIVGEVLAADPTPVPPERFTFWGVWLPAGVASMFAPAIIGGYFGWWVLGVLLEMVGAWVWLKRLLFRKPRSVLASQAPTLTGRTPT